MKESVFCAFVAVIGAGISTATLHAAEEKTTERLVYVTAFAAGEEGAVHAFAFDPQTGKLSHRAKAAEVEHPFFIALSPDSKYLYSIYAPGRFGGEDHEQVAAYRIAGPSGELELLNKQSARGSAACYLAVDATGKTLLLANYTTGSIASYPIKEDGSLGDAASFFQHEGSSVHPQRQQKPHAHCIVVSPENKFAYVADLGLDKVLAYRLDAKTAKLTSGKQPFVRTPPGAGPRHMTFAPDGKRAYVINELANSITVFDYDSETGMLVEKQTLSTLPEDFDGTSYCADVKATPCGKYLYGTNRGHDSIAAYRIGEDGMLTLVGIYPSLGNGPQNLAIAPGGKFLLCANMPGGNVAVFAIDGETGELTAVGDPVATPGPSCILFR